MLLIIVCALKMYETDSESRRQKARKKRSESERGGGEESKQSEYEKKVYGSDLPVDDGEAFM